MNNLKRINSEYENLTMNIITGKQSDYDKVKYCVDIVNVFIKESVFHKAIMEAEEIYFKNPKVNRVYYLKHYKTRKKLFKFIKDSPILYDIHTALTEFDLFYHKISYYIK